MDMSLEYGERLLLAPWPDLSAEDKSHAISLACRIAFELTNQEKLSTKEIDYYTDVVKPIWPLPKGSNISPDTLEWWNTIRTNCTYGHDERVKAFKKAIKILKQAAY